MGLDIHFFSVADNQDRKEIAYFRKFNALWAWVDNHVEPVQNCRETPMDKVAFVELQSTLNALDATNCAELFPTQCGFFFGSQDYDQYYWEDVNDLKTFVENTLASFNFDTNKIHFYAWW